MDSRGTVADPSLVSLIEDVVYGTGEFTEAFFHVYNELNGRFWFADSSRGCGKTAYIPDEEFDLLRMHILGCGSDCLVLEQACMLQEGIFLKRSCAGRHCHGRKFHNNTDPPQHGPLVLRRSAVKVGGVE